MLVAHNQKVKYDDKKIILQIDNVDEYNKIGQTEGSKKDNLGHEYVTRKKEAQKANSNLKVKIDKQKLVKKKTITIPETEKDRKYLAIIESKKEIFDQINSRRGYVRLFQHHYLPDPGVYEATINDIHFINNMNKKLASSLKLKVIAFEKILELWEENCVKEAEIDYKNAVRTIRESEESELKSKAALSEENLRKVYKVNFSDFLINFLKIEKMTEI